MPDQEDSPHAPVQPEPRIEDDQPFQWRATFLVAIVSIALIAIAFTAGFMALYAEYRRVSSGSRMTLSFLTAGRYRCWRSLLAPGRTLPEIPACADGYKRRLCGKYEGAKTDN